MTETDLLDGIVQHPEERERWLILADWLEDHGDPRSELAQLRYLLQAEPEQPELDQRQHRQAALLAAGLRPVALLWTSPAGIDFAWIPPGSFLMGSPETEKEREDHEKQHRVTLPKGFYLGIYPVTQAQWREVMGDNPSYFSRSGSYKGRVKDISDADLDRFPVENVSWLMAQEFCAKLSKKFGHKVELPTEAEWEYSCRAGTTTPYHFGSILNGKQANCGGNYPYGTSEKGPYLRRPTPVGLPEYPANAWGLQDMHGNVWEWCADAYLNDYTKLGTNDPLGVGKPDDPRVIRGGSWSDYAKGCRAANRSYGVPSNRVYYKGFRVALRLD